MTPLSDRSTRLWLVAGAAIAVFYLLASVDSVTRTPLVHGDEMWNAAPAYSLATTGVYGSDMFTGFCRAEQRTYQFMPLLQMLLALDFSIFGVGVLQIRLLSILVGGVVLWMTFVIGRRTGDVRVGVIAMALLAIYRLASGGLETGVILVDLVRTTRYHVLASAFGLASLVMFLRAEDRRAVDGRRAIPYTLVGFFAGLAFLSHIYGAFWVPAIGAAMALRRGWRGVLSIDGVAIVVGFALTCVPWAIYVAGDPDAYAGQMRQYAERFNVFDPRFYLANLVAEIRRYHEFGRRDLLTWRPGLWLALLTFPAALVWAIRSARRRPDDAMSAVVVSLLVIVFLFGLLLKWKTFTYLLTPLPLAMIVLAAGWVRGWDWIAARTTRPRLVHASLIGMIAILAIESAQRLQARHRGASATTSYEEIGQRLASVVPEHAVVVGPHRYWLPLKDRTYRTWLTPLTMTDPAGCEPPVTLDRALARVDPDIVIFDEREFGRYFESLAPADHPRHAQYVELHAFLRDRGAQRLATIDDPWYGRIDVFEVRSSRTAAAPPPR